MAVMMMMIMAVMRVIEQLSGREPTKRSRHRLAEGPQKVFSLISEGGLRLDDYLHTLKYFEVLDCLSWT